MLRRPSPTTLWVYLFLACSVFIFYSSYIFSGDLLLSWDILPGYGLWTYLKTLLFQGTIPFWMDSAMAGRPWIEGLPGDSGYPPFLVTLMILPVKYVYGFLFIAHTFLAGVLAYHLLLSRFKLTPFPAAVFAFCYMLNTNYVSHIYPGHSGKFWVLSWLPLGLYFLTGLINHYRWKHVLGLSAFVAICIFTSHVQLTYFTLIGFFVFFMGSLWILHKAHEPTKLIVKRFGLFWIAIIIGLGLGSPILYPAFAYASEYSARSDAQHTSFEHAVSWSSHPEEIASLIVPEFTGFLRNYWGRNQLKFNSEYSGLVVLILASLGFILFRQPKYWLGWVIALLSIIFSLGAHTPIFSLFFHVIPGVKQFRGPSMMFFWFATILFLMTAYFWADLEKARESFKDEKWKLISKRLLIASGILLFIGVVGSLNTSGIYNIWNGIFSDAVTSIRFRPPYGKPESFFQLQSLAAKDLAIGFLRFGILSAVICGGLALYIKAVITRKQVLIALVVVAAIDLYSAGLRFVQTVDEKKIIVNIPLYHNLVKSDTSFYRAFDVPGSFQQEKGFGGFYGLRLVSGFYDNELKIYREFHGGSQDYSRFMSGLQMVSAPRSDNNGVYVPGILRGSKYLDMLRVKYVLAKDGRGTPLYFNNESVMPHIFWTPCIKEAEEDAALSYIISDQFDPRKEAVILKSSGIKLNEHPPEQCSIVEGTVTYSSNHIEAEINAPASGLVVLSEVYHPFWKVTVDGQAADLLRANYAFRGLWVGKGNHKISMSYKSPHIRLSFYIFIVSFILWVSILGVRRKINF